MSLTALSVRRRLKRKAVLHALNVVSLFTQLPIAPEYLELRLLFSSQRKRNIFLFVTTVRTLQLPQILCINNEIHVIRLGDQRTDESIRPVKVILSNADDALKVLKGKRRHDVFNYLKESKINISPDLTIMQRQHMRDLKAQLETRKANGELITIKYRNGSPTIVPEPAQHPKN